MRYESFVRSELPVLWSQSELSFLEAKKCSKRLQESDEIVGMGALYFPSPVVQCLINFPCLGAFGSGIQPSDKCLSRDSFKRLTESLLAEVLPHCFSLLASSVLNKFKIKVPNHAFISPSPTLPPHRFFAFELGWDASLVQ